MVKVSPSILSADFVNLERDIRSLGPAGADYVHVDVMDGLFVPNLTIGIPVVQAIRRISPLPLDVHLMIDRPIRYVERFCAAGADILTVHVEADTEANTLEALRKIQAAGVRPAISVKPATPAEAVLPYLDLCSLVLVMTVEPGFGGQSFMADMMPKITEIRRYITEKGLNCEVEGGRRRQRDHRPHLRRGRRGRPGGRQRLLQGPPTPPRLSRRSTGWTRIRRRSYSAVSRKPLARSTRAVRNPSARSSASASA